MQQGEVATSTQPQRTICLANTPPGVHSETVRRNVVKYGQVHGSERRFWPQICSYELGKGVRLVTMDYSW